MTMPDVSHKMIMAGVVIALVVVVIYSKQPARYQPVEQLPTYAPDSQPQDGDTQTDTIKALQAYAKAAVGKATALNQRTEDTMGQVLDNQQQLARLNQDGQAVKSQQQQAQQRLQDLHDQLQVLQRQWEQQAKRPPVDSDDLPVGFGFDGLVKKIRPNKGRWYDPIDRASNTQAGDQGDRFQRLLSPPRGVVVDPTKSQSVATESVKERIDPAYTLPKDAILTDAVALTALIGRIPVKGTTPDPYPVKFFIGKDNLAANGHRLPEVEGMLFSGLGFGDWNLSCVNARLMSATFIFTDGTIVNHSQTDKPLGYISDPSGIPCIAGQFVSNAPHFFLQRAGIAALGAAGSAYADAQQQTQTSSLTGTTTRSVLGDIDTLVAGEMVQSTTEEANRWLLERQQQSFDAVVVDPGTKVAIHLETTLALDYSSLARKLRYVSDNTVRSNGLD